MLGACPPSRTPCCRCSSARRPSMCPRPSCLCRGPCPRRDHGPAPGRRAHTVVRRAGPCDAPGVHRPRRPRILLVLLLAAACKPPAPTLSPATPLGNAMPDPERVAETQAAKDGKQGAVKIAYCIDTDGKPQDLRVVEPLEPALRGGAQQRVAVDRAVRRRRLAPQHPRPLEVAGHAAATRPPERAGRHLASGEPHDRDRGPGTAARERPQPRPQAVTPAVQHAQAEEGPVAAAGEGEPDVAPAAGHASAV